MSTLSTRLAALERRGAERSRVMVLMQYTDESDKAYKARVAAAQAEDERAGRRRLLVLVDGDEPMPKGRE